eukprot:GILI01026876.1.p1 GENE.GILI01026876.1~~GILI01026876.1.p1  ORF type:complete len:301 (-),score=39.73 GILI01026876.1:64-849(-)
MLHWQAAAFHVSNSALQGDHHNDVDSLRPVEALQGLEKSSAEIEKEVYESYVLVAEALGIGVVPEVVFTLSDALRGGPLLRGPTKTIEVGKDRALPPPPTELLTLLRHVVTVTNALGIKCTIDLDNGFRKEHQTIRIATVVDATAAQSVDDLVSSLKTHLQTDVQPWVQEEFMEDDIEYNGGWRPLESDGPPSLAPSLTVNTSTSTPIHSVAINAIQLDAAKMATHCAALFNVELRPCVVSGSESTGYQSVEFIIYDKSKR